MWCVFFDPKRIQCLAKDGAVKVGPLISIKYVSQPKTGEHLNKFHGNAACCLVRSGMATAHLVKINSPE